MLKFGDTYLNFGGTYLSGLADPYNPLNLPPNTVRVRTNDGNAPVKSNNTYYETATLVYGTTDVYDVYKSGTDFSDLLCDSTNVVEVLGANTTGITHMIGMFLGCSSLTTVQPFDTSNVDRMDGMLSDCINVQSGALALYNQVSTQPTPPEGHNKVFYNCGINTETGSAELAKIPSDWK